MCGNSIGVDRRFLDAQLPELDQYLHYRSIDVSSFKELCRRWYPEVYKKRPGKTEKHRALADVEESIAEMRYYREAMLRPIPSCRAVRSIRPIRPRGRARRLGASSPSAPAPSCP